MVFGSANAALRGKGTMVVRGDVLVRDEGGFEEERSVAGGLVIEKEVGEGVRESFEDGDNLVTLAGYVCSTTVPCSTRLFFSCAK